MENSRESFWQFSDQLRLQTSSFANLSINNSIWSTSFGTKSPEDRRNFDVNGTGDIDSSYLKQRDLNLGTLNESSWNTFLGNKKSEDRYNYDVKGGNESWVGGSKKEGSNFNACNDGWKVGFSNGPVKPSYTPNGSSVVGGNSLKSSFNGGFSKGIYSKSVTINRGNNIIVNPVKNAVASNDDVHGGKPGKKNGNSGSRNSNSNNNNSDKSSVDKRFKSLPASESLPRNETIGGYIFVCNNDTMHENLKRQLFGLPPRYRDSVRVITPGLPLFLYNYSTHQLHGIFEAAGFGGSNIDPKAWEDKKCFGESRFPAQVRIVTRKICEPLEEDSFRPILHHYDGPKFRLELSVPEVISLLDIFEETSA